MTTNLNEYKQRPELSDQAQLFLNTHKEGPIPDEIRKELEKFFEESKPFVDQARLNLKKQFERVFNK